MLGKGVELNTGHGLEVTYECLYMYILKSFLMKVKEESEKASLKLNIKKSKIMASSPITSWQIEGKKVETKTDLILLGSENTVDGDCHHEIKR